MIELTKMFSTLFIILMFIITFISTIYGHWTKRLYIKGQVKTGDPKLNIMCCRACTMCCACASCGMLNDHEAEVRLKGSKCWILYVKVLVINNGTIPMIMEYNVELPEGFKVKSYFLGPYKVKEINITSIMQDIMRHAWLNEPPNLDRGEGFIAVHIIKPNCLDVDEGIYRGFIEYTGRFNSWSAHAYVTLTFNITSLTCCNK